MPSGAWGKRPSDAIRAPPSVERSVSTGSNASSSNRRRSNRQRSSGSGRGGGRGGGGRGRGGGNQNNNSNNNSSNRTVLNVKLLLPGEGKTERQKQVKRITAEHLLDMRLLSMDPLPSWTAPEHCGWTNDEERVKEIMEKSKAKRRTGEVSRPPPRRNSVKETAPPLEECKPLEVNDETRWKARVFEKDESAIDSTSNEEILKKAMLILNKLSLTKFEKLSTDFVETGIGQSVECLSGAVGMIVDKAQSEPHFSSMYAQLCFKLSKNINWSEEVGGRKAFKRLLLQRCQSEFEEDMSKKIDTAIAGVDDAEKKEYLTGIVKKQYLGHMRFIGELYKGDLIKLDVMLFCLNTLLDSGSSSGDETTQDEEERVECFAKLMTTIGFPLEQQSTILAQQHGKPAPQKELNGCWKKVDEMIEGGKVSNRIKFMLLDLKEMKNKGWVKRRKEETAKTLDQIHKDVAREEAAARRASATNRNSLRRSSSDVRSKPATVVDQDGFVQVLSNSRSSGNLARSVSDARGGPSNSPHRPKMVRRAQSFSVASNTSRRKSKSPPQPKGIMSRNSAMSRSAPEVPAPPLASKTFPSLKDVETKAQNLLKEFFVAGDTSDAVLTIDELVGLGQDDQALDRGAKLVEASVLLILERKEEDVTRMLTLLKEAHQQGKLSNACFVRGLNDPLEFLSDIEIDAPMASKFLAKVMADWIQSEIIKLDVLLSAPEYFLSDGKPAHFASKILMVLDDNSQENLDVLDKLMTDEDRKTFASAAALLENAKAT